MFSGQRRYIWKRNTCTHTLQKEKMMTTPRFLSSEVCSIHCKAGKPIIHLSQVLATDSPTQAHL